MVQTMRKGLVYALIAVLALTCAIPAAAFAAQSPTTSVKPVVSENTAVDKPVNGVTPKVDTKKDGTATLSTVAKTNKTSVTISSKVTVNGVKYTVTTVDAKAFAKCTKATKVTLPATVKTINKNAFTGAKKLKTVVLNTKKAITVKKGAFSGLNTKKMTIKVSKSMSKKELQKFQKTLKKAGFKGTVKKLSK